MWADVTTKPLSGKPYRVMRGELMNVDVGYNDEKEHIATHPMILPKDNCQEEPNKSLQVLAKACTSNPTPKFKSSVNKTEA